MTRKGPKPGTKPVGRQKPMMIRRMPMNEGVQLASHIAMKAAWAATPEQHEAAAAWCRRFDVWDNVKAAVAARGMR